MSELPYPVSSGYISEVSAKMIIAALSNTADTRTVVEKMEGIGFTLQDYLDLFSDERFQAEYLDYNVKMQIFPRMPMFFERHMIAASKGGRGSARVIKWVLQSYFKKLAEAQRQTNVQINTAAASRESSEIAQELIHIRENVLPDVLSKYEKELDPQGNFAGKAKEMLEIVVHGEAKVTDHKGADPPRATNGSNADERSHKGTRKKKGSKPDGGLRAPSGTEGVP